MKLRTLEITTYIGCPVMCDYCPQDLLKSTYKGKKKMTIDDFKRLLNNVPSDVDIHFSGFSELFYHKDAVEFIKIANKNHKIAVYTTTKGLKEEQIKEMSTINFKDFLIHKVEGSISIPFVKELEITDNNVISRGGNLFTKNFVKRGVCRKSKTFERNVVLPNGDVYVCCMDYGLENKIGNLFEDNYNDLKRCGGYEICKKCEYYTPTSLLKSIYSKIRNLI